MSPSGNLAVRSGGEGSLDYMVELLVNVLPNALRNVIMDKLEPKIHQVRMGKRAAFYVDDYRFGNACFMWSLG